MAFWALHHSKAFVLRTPDFPLALCLFPARLQL
jgi:hypothetical protein